MICKGPNTGRQFMPKMIPMIIMKLPITWSQWNQFINDTCYRNNFDIDIYDKKIFVEI